MENLSGAHSWDLHTSDPKASLFTTTAPPLGDGCLRSLGSLSCPARQLPWLARVASETSQASPAFSAAMELWQLEPWGRHAT